MLVVIGLINKQTALISGSNRRIRNLEERVARLERQATGYYNSYDDYVSPYDRGL